MRQVEIVIDNKGHVNINAIGFSGSGCSDVTEVFTSALGGRVVDEGNKPEFYVEECLTEGC